MKRIVLTAIGLSVLLMLLLASCGTGAHGAEATGSPWPTHAPGATPYIRVMPAEAALPPEGGGAVSGGGWDTIYERFGSFYAKKDELEYFRSLPEDTVYPFLPHSARFVLDEGEALRMARLFRAQERVDARVIALHQITNGLDDWSFLTVVSCTPARLFELSGEMDEEFMFERFYPSVQERFDIDYWPVGLYQETEKALQGYEIRGCFYFKPETLEQLADVDRDEVLDLALKEFAPGGWSEDGQQLLWILRGRELESLGLRWREGSGESLCVASMTIRQLSVLSDTLPGRYLVSLDDGTVKEYYNKLMIMTPDGEVVEG